MATASTAATMSLRPPSPSPPRLAGLQRRWCWGVPTHSPGRRAFHANRRRRSTLLCTANKGPEKSFKKIIEVDRLIDMLRNANPTEEISNREKGGQLDEGFLSFLSEVNAQLRQAKEDGDKPGLKAVLQKVLQLYASKFLQKHSYANKGEVMVPERILESVIQAPENEWNKLLLDGLTVGNGDVSPEELYAVIQKRIERILFRTEGGSYQQRVLVEYLKEIRVEEIVKVLQGPTM